MRVVLFASALLVAAGQALSLASPLVQNAAECDAAETLTTSFAQTDAEQLGAAMGLPDQNQLKTKAASAIDKDDKKKMGSEKHAMFHKVKKILSGKNDKARDMAGVLADVVDGKPIPGLDKKQEPKPDEPEPPKNDDQVDAYKDNINFKDTVMQIQTKLEARSREREKESEAKLQKVVEQLRTRMEDMKRNMLQKSVLDQQAAVVKYEVAQKKMSNKIYNKMKTNLPKQMRAVIQNAAQAFRKGKVTAEEVEKLLDKHFSDEVWQNILKCVQGDLTYCTKLNLTRWQQAADKDIFDLSKKAKQAYNKEEARKTQEVKARVDGIINEKSGIVHTKRQNALDID